MASCLLFTRSRGCLAVANALEGRMLVKDFQTSVVLQKEKFKSGIKLSKECEERTKHILVDHRKVKQLYTPPHFSKNITELFKFFPLSPEVVERTLMDHPEVLLYNAAKAIEFIQVLVECGDYDVISQEEALLFVARCPEILKYDKEKFKEHISNMFGLTATYDIPWNMVIVASPITLTLNPDHIGHVVELLTKFFSIERIRDVIGNNPHIFEVSWDVTEAKIDYLQKTMNVSEYRIAMTPKSLTHDLEFLQLRYEFLCRSGHYRHPDPTAKSALPVEASPALHLITDTDDQRFVHKCCPGLSVEEFNIFKTVLILENSIIEDETFEEDDYNDDDKEDNSYTVLLKQRSKTKKTKRVVVAKP